MAPTPFARLELRASASVDRIHAEQVRVEPRLEGEVVSGPDPARPHFVIRAVIDIKPVMAHARASQRYGGSDSGVDADNLQCSVATSALPANRASWPRAGDYLRLVDRDDTPAAKIVKVDADGIGRIVYKLVWI